MMLRNRINLSSAVGSAVVSSVVTAAEIASMPPLTGPYNQPKVYFKASSDPRLKNSPSVLFGPAPEGVAAIEGPSEGLGAGQPLYKITSPTCDYVSLRLTLLRAGFRRITAGPRCDKLPANVVWGKSMPAKEPPAGSPKERAFLSTRLLHPHQRFNHFPSSHANLGCKAGMALNLNRRHSTTEGFHPETFIYPTQRAAIREWIGQSPRHERFIWKPARGSCGRGIMICGGGDVREVGRIEEFIARKVRECEAAGTSPALFKHYVIQRYIADPLLIDKKKFDLRLYVAVTSFSPSVVAYRHQVGFARFAATEYKDDAIGEKYSHLTNFSVGRKVFMDGVPEAGDLVRPDGSSVADVDRIVSQEVAVAALKEASEKAAELKWTTDRLDDVLDNHQHRVTAAPGVAVDKASMWAAVDNVIRETLLAAQPRIARKMAEQDQAYSKAVGRPTSFNDSYFELYGFDIMFDAHCRPWIIEVNTLPSLESSSVRDYHVKSKVVSDLLNMAMIRPFDRTHEERSLFATVHHTASYGEGPTAEQQQQEEAVADSEKPIPTVAYPRDALSEPSDAAKRFLVGATDSDRFDVVPAADAEARAYRLADQDAVRGGFIRIM